MCAHDQDACQDERKKNNRIMMTQSTMDDGQPHPSAPHHTTKNNSNTKRISFAKEIDFEYENSKEQRRLRKAEKKKKMNADLRTLFYQMTDPLKARSVFHWYSSNAAFALNLNGLLGQHGIAQGPAIVPGPPPTLTRASQFDLLARLGELLALDNAAIQASSDLLSAMMAILVNKGGWNVAAPAGGPPAGLTIPFVTHDNTPDRGGAGNSGDGANGGGAGALAGGEN